MDDIWALPGGTIYMDESAEEAANRILYKMSGMKDIYLDPVRVFSEVERVKPWRVVTVAFYALINIEKHDLKIIEKLQPVDEDKKEYFHEPQCFDIYKLPDMLYGDHKSIIYAALVKLQRRLKFEPIGYELLPEKFTLRQLQDLYESIYHIKLDNRNFRKKILKIGYLVDLIEKQTGVAHRAARLYRFDQSKYNELLENGINMNLLPISYNGF